MTSHTRKPNPLLSNVLYLTYHVTKSKARWNSLGLQTSTVSCHLARLRRSEYLALVSGLFVEEAVPLIPDGGVRQVYGCFKLVRDLAETAVVAMAWAWPHFDMYYIKFIILRGQGREQ